MAPTAKARLAFVLEAQADFDARVIGRLIKTLEPYASEPQVREALEELAIILADLQRDSRRQEDFALVTRLIQAHRDAIIEVLRGLPEDLRCPVVSDMGQLCRDSSLLWHTLRRHLLQGSPSFERRNQEVRGLSLELRNRDAAPSPTPSREKPVFGSNRKGRSKGGRPRNEDRKKLDLERERAIQSVLDEHFPNEPVGKTRVYNLVRKRDIPVANDFDSDVLRSHNAKFNKASIDDASAEQLEELIKSIEKLAEQHLNEVNQEGVDTICDKLRDKRESIEKRLALGKVYRDQLKDEARGIDKTHLSFDEQQFFA